MSTFNWESLKSLPDQVASWLAVCPLWAQIFLVLLVLVPVSAFLTWIVLKLLKLVDRG